MSDTTLVILLSIGVPLLFLILVIGVVLFYRWYWWNRALDEGQRQKIIKEEEYRVWLLSSNPDDLNEEQLKERKDLIEEEMIELYVAFYY